jgi:hypothetical protein
LGEQHADLTFAGERLIYLAGSSGALHVLTADRTNSWNLRTAWQGDLPLLRVAHSKQQNHLIIVDANNRASLLNLEIGRISPSDLQLPDSVTEIIFSPSETRALIRTARWVHLVDVSPAGLQWIDALRAPRGFSGSNMAFDGDSAGDFDPLGGRVVLLTRDTGFAEVAELQFSPVDGPILIGTRQSLLDEWNSKIATDGD